MAPIRTILLLFIVSVSCQRREDCATFDGGINMCDYESHEQMLRRLVNLATRYPSIASIDTIGNSAQGRHLAYIKISRNVTKRSHLEPMFKYVGNMRKYTARQILRSFNKRHSIQTVMRLLGDS